MQAWEKSCKESQGWKEELGKKKGRFTYSCTGWSLYREDENGASSSQAASTASDRAAPASRLDILLWSVPYIGLPDLLTSERTALLPQDNTPPIEFHRSSQSLLRWWWWWCAEHARRRRWLEERREPCCPKLPVVSNCLPQEEAKKPSVRAAVVVSKETAAVANSIRNRYRCSHPIVFLFHNSVLLWVV
jgi:hypothetical protein